MGDVGPCAQSSISVLPSNHVIGNHLIKASLSIKSRHKARSTQAIAPLTRIASAFDPEVVIFGPNLDRLKFSFNHFLTQCRQRSVAFARRRPKTTLALAVLLLLWLFCLPRPLFRKPLSVVLEDRRGELLGARIAEDGQWRFPLSDSIPDKYAKCVVAFEDKRYW